MKPDIQKQFLESTADFYFRFLQPAMLEASANDEWRLLNGQLFWVMDEVMEAMMEAPASFNFAVEIFDAMYATLVASNIIDWQLTESFPKRMNPFQTLAKPADREPHSLRYIAGRLKSANDHFHAAIDHEITAMYEDQNDEIRSAVALLLRVVNSLYDYLCDVVVSKDQSLSLLDEAAAFVIAKNNNKTLETHRYSTVEKKIVRISQ